MRRHVIGMVSVAVGTLGIFLGACSSSNSGTGSASTSSAFADQYCSYMASCCGAESYPSDGKQCHSILAFYGSGTYNEQAGNACIAAVQAASQKDPAWCVDDVSETNKACDPVFGKGGGGGSVQPGGTCSTDSDCASPPAGDTVQCRSYFGSSSNSTTKICQVWTRGKVGDTCGGTQTDIASGTETSYVGSDGTDGGTYPSQITICYTDDGVTCSGSSSSGYTCAALGQVGDSCQSTGSNGCVPTAYCDFSSEKCLARIATGQACTSQNTCVAGDYCDINGSGSCAAQLGSGAACTSSEQCQSSDCTNGKCGAGFGSLGLSLFCGNPVSSVGDAGK